MKRLAAAFAVFVLPLALSAAEIRGTVSASLGPRALGFRP